MFVAQTHFKRSNLLSLNKSMCLFQQHYYFCWCEAFPQFTCWYLYSNNVTAHAQKPWLLLFVTKLSSMTVHTKIRVFTVYLWIYTNKLETQFHIFMIFWGVFYWMYLTWWTHCPLLSIYNCCLYPPGITPLTLLSSILSFISFCRILC